MKAFQYKLEEDLKHLQNLQNIYSQKEGWIVESENHVNVGDGNGLNGTAFAVKSPLSCRCVQIWDTMEEAEKHGANYYLIDGKSHPVYMKFTKAYYFFSREIEKTKELLLFIKSRT